MTRNDDTERNGREGSNERRPSLKDVSHTNPRTGESFGDAMVYRRGPTVAADGGKADTVPDAEDADADDETGTGTGADADASGSSGGRLKDVDHTPARGDVEVNRVHERGGEEIDGDENADVDE